MLETGILLLFLVPGLAAYAAVYGLFHNGKPIAPEPPSANTVEAVAIIAGASIVVHALTAGGFSLSQIACETWCPSTISPDWKDPYGSILSAVAGKGIDGSSLAAALLGIIAQAAITYQICRWRLGHLARRDRLPAWIYGWATDLADSLDNHDRVIIAYVLTTTDCGDRAVGYGGLIHDMALKSDGCISRITLHECERYLIDLSTGIEDASLSDTMSRFSFMAIDASNIRNIAFETITLDEIV